MSEPTAEQLLYALRDAAEALKIALRKLDEETDDCLLGNWQEAFDAIDAAIPWSNLE